MSDSRIVDKAQAKVDAARARLLDTTQEIQDRLAPSRLLNEAMTDARTRSAALVRTAGDVARDRPATIAAAAIAGVALIARKPLLRLGRRLFGRGEATDGDAAS
jgi:ElaB/YqjD/DUF883 family membrane-anchored ribosome-binding protein